MSRMRSLSMSVVVAMACQPMVSIAAPPSPDYKLVFEDTFDGNKVNDAAWCYRVDRRGGAEGDGFIHGLNLKQNVGVADGMMKVRLDRETIHGKLENTGGGLITRQRFGFGYYECRYKPFMGGNRGVHTAFWQRGISAQSSGFDPTAAAQNVIFEIDSSELDNPRWDGTNNLYLAIGPRAGGVPWPHRGSVAIEPDMDGFVVDAYEYTPQGVIFYDNGKEVSRVWFDAVRGQQEVWLTALNGFSYKSMDTSIFPCESLFDYFRYCARDYPGENLLANDGFEYNMDAVDWQTPISWRETGDMAASSANTIKAHTGSFSLRHAADQPYKITTDQTLQNILDGTYTASAMVRSSGGQKVARFTVSSGDVQKTVDIVASEEWTRIDIPEINVTGHQATIAFTSDAAGDQWLEADDVVFMKPPLPGQTVKAPAPLKLPGDPVFKLFDHEMQSMADGRQYLLDRMVGAGPAISVSFTLKSDKLADQNPVERIPATGDSGWAVRLTKDGSVVFRIGSNQTCTDVVAPGAYSVGKPVHVACVFEKGVATIYLDGKQVATQKDITFLTDNLTTVGSIGRPFTKSPTTFPYTGEIGAVRIYNRAMTTDEIAAK
jgi:hypothetical protein